MRFTFLIVILISFTSFNANADFWEDPKVTDYFSENGEYFVRVYPTEIPAKYWKWQKANQRRKAKFSKEDTTIIMCHATLFKIQGKDTLVVWEHRLINRTAPVTVIVANDGSSIVTFDNWGSMGFGLDVMVTYDENGRLVKRYQLEDFSPYPINTYTMSISSFWWRCGVQYIDNQEIEICFSNDYNEERKLTYNLVTRAFK
jgi:hypothetical protein